MDISSMVEGIAKLSEQAIPLEEGDYLGDDGLYYCHKCNTPKQVRVQNPFVDGKFDIRRCLCRCRIEEREKAEAERKQRELERRVAEYRRIGFPESDMEDWTFANDDRTNEKISNIMQNYVANFDKMREDGKGLLLFGTVGTGKTFAAACVANALIDKGIPVLMTNFARIRNTVQGLFDGRQAYFDSLNRFPLLILDDLNAESKTEYMQEIVYNVIDGRYRAGLPLIVTTNLSADELKHPADVSNQRTFSRLLEMCIPVEVKGGDRRREKLKEEFADYKKLLGL